MIIDDLTPGDKKLYCMCLEDWSGEMKEVRTGPPSSYEKIRRI